MDNLVKVFNECKENKILINTDEELLVTSRDINYSKEKDYIGYIYSETKMKDIIDSFDEEGSSIINYRINTINNNINKIIFIKLIVCIFFKYSIAVSILNSK